MNNCFDIDYYINEIQSFDTNDLKVGGKVVKLC